MPDIQIKWRIVMKQTGVCRSTDSGLAVFITLATIISTTAVAADQSLQQAPKSLAVAITIDSEHLIELHHSVPDLKIIDSRHHQDYTQGYIETSTNLPLRDTACGSLKKLTKNKDQALVFYCNGSLDDASIDAIQIASSCGYKRLFWFRGGFVEWADKDYPYLIE